MEIQFTLLQDYFASRQRHTQRTRTHTTHTPIPRYSRVVFYLALPRSVFECNLTEIINTINIYLRAAPAPASRPAPCLQPAASVDAE